MSSFPASATAAAGDSSASSIDGKKRKRDDSESEQTDKQQKEDETTETHNKKAKQSPLDDDDADDDADARPSFGMANGAAAAASGDTDDSAAAASSGPSSIGSRLLKLAGYSGTGGLGKRGSGISEPIAASTQLSTEGLGYVGTVRTRSHTFESFKVEIELKPQWLITSSNTKDLPTEEEMATWMLEGKRDWTCVTSDRFCSSELQQQLLDSKTAFDQVPSTLFRSARTRSNPFESIQKEFFQNRAALKMVELDAMCGRIFTSPPMLKMARKRELLYVGDICAGPGGFSEFMLTVLKWRVVMCGFTLRDGASDFTPHKFNRNAPTQNFHAFYGADGTGDITRTENMLDYRAKIMSLSHGKGLHVVMGDGGFSVVKRENLQEYLSRQLVLCQFLTALMTLQKGGVFVCKLFDSFLPFTVDLLWILRKHFTHFALVKPNQSRPANSERYVIAHGLKQENPPVVQYLIKVNDRINQLKKGYTSQLSDVINIDFGASRDRETKERDRKIRESWNAANPAAATKFLSGGQLNPDGSSPPASSSSSGAPTTDPLSDRGDGKDMFGRDIPVQTDEEKAEAAREREADAAKAEEARIAREIDVLGLVPESILNADRDFIGYMHDRNDTFARRQIFTLHRLKQYVEDINLPSDDQHEIRQQCLKFWSLTQEAMPPLPPLETLTRSKHQNKTKRYKSKKKKSSKREKRHRSRRSRSGSRSRSRSRSTDRSSESDRDDDADQRDRKHRSRHSRRSSRSRSRSNSSRSSRSRSHSRSSSSRTPSPSRSPSPAPIVASVKKGYVHFDPLWQTKLFDPSFPHNPDSIFWTSAQSRRMVEYHIPDELKKIQPLVTLPNESERAALRMHAERYPKDEPDPRMVQLDTLARSARSWYVLPVPAGGIRHTVWFTLSGMGHIDEHGRPHSWSMEPRMHVPPDAVLDVVWSGGRMYVLDALALPTPADLAMYRTRPRLLERRELVDMFIDSCGESRLLPVKPIPLLDWRRSPESQLHPPTCDLFLLRDGPRVPPMTSYYWNIASDEMHFTQVNELFNYIAAKQAPIPVPNAAPTPSTQQR